MAKAARHSMKRPRAKARTKRRAGSDDCVIPPPIAAKDLPRLVLR
jgi:hypothetical protein